MDELSPIEIRIRRLVEDFFANKITLCEFKWELNRAREKFERNEKPNRKVKQKNTTEDLLPDQAECGQPVHPQL